MENKNVTAKTGLVYKTKTTLRQVGQISNEHLPKMYEFIGKQGMGEIEPTVFIYDGASEDMDKEFELEIALVTGRNGESNGEYQFDSIPEIKCASYDYQGKISGIAAKYDEIFQDLMKKNIKPGKIVREVYHNWVDEESPENKIEIQVELN